MPDQAPQAPPIFGLSRGEALILGLMALGLASVLFGAGNPRERELRRLQNLTSQYVADESADVVKYSVMSEDFRRVGMADVARQIADIAEQERKHADILEGVNERLAGAIAALGPSRFLRQPV